MHNGHHVLALRGRFHISIQVINIFDDPIFVSIPEVRFLFENTTYNSPVELYNSICERYDMAVIYNKYLEGKFVHYRVSVDTNYPIYERSHTLFSKNNIVCKYEFASRREVNKLKIVNPSDYEHLVQLSKEFNKTT